ncbi:proline--tRNA ligase [candidate division CPR3 bacterium GWF2_35_18]|uniref:Proline--tRNA ligase n=1 Tax=candidate division CPR3 bacterium GW2011_GWF2_35_18 TaxID=1618350 RepID=A0A0G0EQ75_UNCC3|nr:MAG: Proline-tRNA ligase [candidate division CPR3 bacterium GW2011_GWF2_35_18]KKP85512.1 MAG: Proline-tRNA ligase [candidate division CPR3 bacterium GW2011_GWE2_35_7]OGB62964.1 MAG: proline--tRNA ligase [candidate division CPR3 bacterium GWF2_35_18]OGB65910.1 MAG: proline--tRNA ligase [candidate division CPR3 bacterium RIFOXYA2_FULL_35_13]OGB77177.1 MAG: proline--tRNA ligase [candidate division CPR3 bacterium RIFOXYC2_FULL_35_7]OGB79270.1 MAG: proline--tRNA ligase [candidate division CPR3 b
MKYKTLFGKTVKNISSEIKTVSHKLLIKSGFIRESTAGRYFNLPLGMKVHNKVIDVIREQMNQAEAQEMITPVLHPIELWKETNRTVSVGFELTTLKDRRGTEFVLGGTAEEMFVEVVKQFNLSYRDLPFNLYQFSSKFRDELRVRGGLLRAREFTMKDAYSFDRDEKEFKKTYEKMKETYTKIFRLLGLETVIVEADNGYIGGEYCHEFQVLSDTGEDLLFYVKSLNKYFNREIAPSQAQKVASKDEIIKEKKDVLGEKIIGVEDLAKYLNIPVEKTTKTLLFEGSDNRLIAAAVRGGYDIDETKLRRIAKTSFLKLASADTIKELTGAEVGFLGPLNLPKKVEVFYDESTDSRMNFECGANKTDYHTINVNWDRDLPKPTKFYDIKVTKEGDIYPETGEKYEVFRGIEVGNIFQLGYHYSKLMNATFRDEDGTEKLYYMGCYGIGIGRAIATIVEKHHDDKGIIWPENSAPFKVELVLLNTEDENVTKVADNLYQKLRDSNVEVLFDDRADVSAGEKLKDADLLGIPYRVVVSKKTVAENKVEYKKRDEDKAILISEAEFIKKIS